MHFPLSKTGSDQEAVPQMFVGDSFHIDLSWELDSHDLDLHALMGYNDGRGLRVLELEAVLSVHNCSLQRSSGEFQTPCRTLVHSGDASNGADQDVDESIVFRGKHAPENVNEVMILVTVHVEPSSRARTFRGVPGSRVCIRDKKDNVLLDRSLFETIGRFNAGHVCSIIRAGDTWRLVEVSQGFHGNLNSVLQQFSLQPTRITCVSSEESATVDSSSLPVAGKPTSLVAKSRGLEVNTDQLRDFDPKCSDDVLDLASGYLANFDIAHLTLDGLVNWGRDLQVEYSTLVDRCTEISQEGTVLQVSKRLIDLRDALELVDFAEVEGLKDDSFFTSFRRGSVEDRRTELLKSLYKAKADIEELREVFLGDKRKLQGLKSRIGTIVQKLDDLQPKILAKELAARYLVAYLREHLAHADKDALIQALDESRYRLMQSSAQILQQASLTELYLNHPCKMVQFVEDIVFRSIPVWLTGFSSVLNQLETMGMPTPTQLNGLSDQHAELRRKLEVFR